MHYPNLTHHPPGGERSSTRQLPCLPVRQCTGVIAPVHQSTNEAERSPSTNAPVLQMTTPMGESDAVPRADLCGRAPYGTEVLQSLTILAYPGYLAPALVLAT